MSQRAAWQLERLGFTDVNDFVVGKAHWLASGRPTERSEPADRVGDRLRTDVAVVDTAASVADARRALADHNGDRVIVVNAENVVLGALPSAALDAVTPETPVVDAMKVGPTTIRPDEEASEVRQRMSRHNVTALIVTAPTGRLLGLFDNAG